MVIVNSLEIAEELLEVQGANFSDRPVIPMGGELVGFKNSLSFSQYGDRVRKERKLFHQLFGTQTAITQFVPLISSEIQQLLQSIALDPGRIVNEVRRFVGWFNRLLLIIQNLRYPTDPQGLFLSKSRMDITQFVAQNKIQSSRCLKLQ